MPRRARRMSSTGIYHIMLRGIDRMVIFHDDEDRSRFLEDLRSCLPPFSGIGPVSTAVTAVPASFTDQNTVSRTGDTDDTKKPAMLFQYCLMDNHVHLLLQTGSDPLNLIMKRVGIKYAGYYNWKYMRTGHLFQDRFRSEPVEDDRYFLAVYRYITLNPVKAGLSDQIGEYPWCGYRSPCADGSDEKETRSPGAFSFGGGICSPLPLDISPEQLDRFIRSEQENISPFPEKISDRQAAAILREKTGFASPEEFRKLEKRKQIQYLFIFQEEGMSPFQISRVTGIPKSNVFRYLRT